MACHDRLVELVQTMLDLQRQLSSAGPEHERTLLARRIEATDRQIDRLVYELYDLTEEERPAGGGGRAENGSQESISPKRLNNIVSDITA